MPSSRHILALCVYLASSVGALASPIVATVNDEAIHADEVLYFLPRSVGERPSGQIWTAAIDLAIQRRLVLAALARRKKMVSETVLDAEISRRERAAAQRGTSLSERLVQRNISADSFRHVLRWQLTWKKYLDANLTDENLQRYYRKHQRDFDGTKIRASHILLPRGNEKSEMAQRLEEAHRIAQEIRNEARSFESAATEYSTAPSAEFGGDVGWIERHQPMSIEFSEAAFRLNPGDISEPVISSAGIHVIRCTDIKPGNRTWREAREQLVDATRNYLFKWLADQERPKANIQIGKSGSLPSDAAQARDKYSPVRESTLIVSPWDR